MDAPIACPQPTCKAHADGKCIEGLDLVKCPHWNSRATLPPPEPTSGKLESLLDWPDGKGIPPEKRGTLSRARQTQTILIAGEPFTGKTTLIGALYLAFHRGRIGSFRFAGSETLLGFEERCFRARLSSGGLAADTAHTPIEQSTVLHLAIDDTQRRTRRDLVLADISGEVLKELYESPASARMMPMARECERVSILLDFPRLADKRQRHVLVARSCQLARTLSEKGVVCTARPLLVVVTKCDTLPESDSAWVGVRDQAQKVTAAAASARIIYTAARKGPGLASGAGFDELLSEWMALAEARAHSTGNPPLRAFDHYDAMGSN